MKTNIINQMGDGLACVCVLVAWVIMIALVAWLMDKFLYKTNFKYRRWYNTNMYGARTSYHFNRKFIEASLGMSDEEFERKVG